MWKEGKERLIYAQLNEKKEEKKNGMYRVKLWVKWDMQWLWLWLIKRTWKTANENKNLFLMSSKWNKNKSGVFLVRCGFYTRTDTLIKNLIEFRVLATKLDKLFVMECLLRAKTESKHGHVLGQDQGWSILWDACEWCNEYMEYAKFFERTERINLKA